MAVVIYYRRSNYLLWVVFLVWPVLEALLEHYYRRQEIPKGPKIEKIQDRPPGLKFSSEIETFKRVTHQTPIFVGEFWSSGIEMFKQDWSFQARLNFFNLWALRECFCKSIAIQMGGISWYKLVRDWIFQSLVGAREGGRTLRKDVFLPSKHLLIAFYETLLSKNPSKNLVVTENP